MSKPKQVGITGGIGVGKSLVCKMFSCLGIPVYNSDDRAKSLMESDRLIRDEIQKLFGPEAYNGVKLNRTYLAKKVFRDPAKVKQLNGIVHPRVAIDYDKWINDQTNLPYVIKEAALMIESESYKLMDLLVLVTASKKLRIERVLKRDDRSIEQIERIIDNQMTEAEKEKYSDIVIDNSEEKLLIPQIISIDEKIRATV